MKNKTKKIRIYGGVAIFAFAIAIFLITFSMSNTVKQISETAISKTPDAILASFGISENKSISVPVLYFDQRADECVNVYEESLKDKLNERQFEWSGCDYLNRKVEQGLVDFKLGEDYLPVALGGDLLPNKGLNDMTRWFDDVDGKSKSYNGVLKMNYAKEGAEFSFSSNKFYPLDEAEFSKDDFVNQDGHNHLFTMNFAVPFTVLASGEESFEITADDDTFVYVGDTLVIDMGGIHEATTGRFSINKKGEIYSAIEKESLAYSGADVKANEGSIVRIFHADRDSKDSEFSIKFSEMNLSVVNTELAESGDNGIQIAYDPNDPSYIPPLGETSVFKPDGTKGLMIMMIIEGVALVVLSVFVVFVARFMLKNRDI